MGVVLRCAALYNVAVGTWAALDPAFPFRQLGAPVPEDGYIWQSVGMILAAFGVGYWCAARDPARHWPIVLVGLIGKVLGPLGFVWTGFVAGTAPKALWPMFVMNDLIWWPAFGAILAHARHVARASGRGSA